MKTIDTISTCSFSAQEKKFKDAIFTLEWQLADINSRYAEFKINNRRLEVDDIMPSQVLNIIVELHPNITLANLQQTQRLKTFSSSKHIAIYALYILFCQSKYTPKTKKYSKGYMSMDDIGLLVGVTYTTVKTVIIKCTNVVTNPYIDKPFHDNYYKPVKKSLKEKLNIDI